MLDFIPVYKREVKTYFQSASTYVVLALLFLFASGLGYVPAMIDFSQRSAAAMQGSIFGQQSAAPNINDVIQNQFSLLSFLVIIIIVPVLSMRLIAEEKDSGTFELLMTNPIGDWSVLLGKYLALCTVGLVIVLTSEVYPLLTVWAAGSQRAAVEWATIVSSSVGFLLAFCTFSAFGLLASSMSNSQIVAAVITQIGLLFWWALSLLGMVLPDRWHLHEILSEMSAFSHSTTFSKGLLTLKDCAYFILLIFVFLFVASKILDARRWRV